MHKLSVAAGDSVKFGNEDGIYKYFCEYEGYVLMKCLRRKKRNKYTLILASGTERICYFKTIFDFDKEKMGDILEILSMVVAKKIKVHGVIAKVWVSSFNGKIEYMPDEFLNRKKVILSLG